MTLLPIFCPFRALPAFAFLCMAVASPVMAASVYFDPLDSAGNLSSTVNLTLDAGSGDLGVAAVTPDPASVVWTVGGAPFDLTGDQTFRFQWTSYTANDGPNLLTVSVVAVYDDPAATEIAIGSSNLFLLVANGDIGNYDIPDVAGASSFAIRLDFTTLLGNPAGGGTPGNATLDYLQIVPEPAGAGMAACGLGLLALRRRRSGVGTEAAGS